LGTGTVPEGVPVLVASKAQAVNFFGRGSLLATMFDTLFDNNAYTEKWAVALDDNPAGVSAVGMITVTGNATVSGMVNLYLGGVLVQATLAAGDTASTIVAAIRLAINARGDLPVTATASDNTVRLLYRHKGLVGNYYDLRLNYRGVNGGEITPSGIKIELTPFVGGTANPDIATAIAALPEEIYDYWLIPYRDAAILDKIDTEMNSRNGGIRMLEGYTFAAAADTVGNLVTLGTGRNNQYFTLFDAGHNSPTPSYLTASALCGQVAFAAANDPARPFNTLKLVGVLAAPPEDRRSFTELNTLLYSGIATHKVASDGSVQVGRAISTYQKNPSGQVDASWLDANVALTLAYLRQTFRNRMTSKYARHKLADDGTRFGAGQAIVTPNVLMGEAIAIYGEWVELGLVQDMDTFKAETIFERNKNDRTRVDCMLAINLVGQFHILATQLAFKPRICS
jgi:phage tail sheath gpL-like